MSFVIAPSIQKQLLKFLQENRKVDLVTVYLFFLEKQYKLKPVLFPKEKTIYISLDELIEKLEKEEALYRETEIHIQFGQESVNEHTTKIYICPFTGKVFGNNTHPNPQDAIYEWVSKCPENVERIGGLRAKRFFVSEDPAIIQNYIQKRKESIKKVVFSSVITGKLFNTKEAVIKDFMENHVKPMTLGQVQNQNRFEIQEKFLSFLQEHLMEEKISSFVDALSKIPELEPYLSQWV